MSNRLLVCALFATLCLHSQQQPPVAQDVTSASQNLPNAAAGVDDLITVSVYGAPELCRSLRIAKDGTIRLPMLPHPLKAAGMMPAELETLIADALKSENILIDPLVTVIIAEYRSRPITVMGAVNRPIKFQAEADVTLLDAISRAQGLAPTAGPEILVSRSTIGQTGDSGGLVRRIPVHGLIGSGDSEFNLILHGGEEIRVPEMGKVFVVGNVKKPGLFPVQDTSGTTVLKVLAFSEGLAPYSAKTCYIYRKDDKTGKSAEIPFDIHAVLARKASDIPLEANDILYVPDNNGRRITIGTLEKLLALGTASSAALVYTTIR